MIRSSPGTEERGLLPPPRNTPTKGPDPSPSLGETLPFAAVEAQTHTFTMAGTYDVTLTVRDDDDGAIQSSITFSM